MTFTKKSIKSLAVALPLLFCSVTVNAAAIKTALSIVIDDSGSISQTDFNTQMAAYAAVLGDNTVVKADGSVVLNVIKFASSASVEQTAMRINNEADRTALIAAVNAITHNGGLTNIGGGIDLGRSNMDTFLSGIGAGEFDTAFRKLIDVSTDGSHNTGTDPTVATTNALAGGYQNVNCLGIGGGADCTWNLGGLDFAATTFAQVESALITKIGKELGTVPEPNILALFALGLLGAFGFRRKYSN